MDSLPTASLLLLANYRPDYRHGWGNKTYYSQLRIDPLPPQSAEELLQAVLGDEANLQPLKQLLIERTEGNPFFLEESVRTLVETKVLTGERGKYQLTGSLEITGVPATVHAVLAARIDRLSIEEKRLLQSAAVIGKDVPFGLLLAISELSEEALRRQLGRLQAAEFLYETRLFPELEYTFKHALTHEVAYGSVLQERRRTIHASIVNAIESLYSHRLNEQVESLAHHASRGELSKKAVSYLHQAGKKAAVRSANREAAEYFQQALNALEHLPQSRETLEQAIDIRIDLGPALIATRGNGAPEVEETYTKARELCQRLGETLKLFPVLWALSRMYNHRGQLQAARELGEQLLTMAGGVQDSALLLEAHHTLWAILATVGELAAAQMHAQHGIAIYNKEQHSHLAFLYGGHDPGVCCRTHAARQLFLLGYPDQALKRSLDALALGRDVSHPFSLALALLWMAWIYQQRGDTQAAQERTDALLAIGAEHGFPRFVVQGTFLRGRLLVEQGQVEEGIVQMRQAAASHLVTSLGRERAYFSGSMAEAFGRGARIAEGLRTVTGELVNAQETGARFYEAELHRINGELLLSQSGADEEQVEGFFRQSIEIARRQEAKSLELRGAMSLSRLWQTQGKNVEAQRLLADIYGWFTEGFDTADLKAAKALLEKLA